MSVSSREVTPSAQADLRLAAVPQSAGAARRFTREHLDNWQVGVVVDEVVLMVSELVTNVGLHARTDAVVHLEVAAGRVRVEVSDASPRLPERRDQQPGAETGRGLLIVDALADAWGVQPGALGKTVWFEVEARETEG